MDTAVFLHNAVYIYSRYISWWFYMGKVHLDFYIIVMFIDSSMVFLYSIIIQYKIIPSHLFAYLSQHIVNYVQFNTNNLNCYNLHIMKLHHSHIILPFVCLMHRLLTLILPCWQNNPGWSVWLPCSCREGSCGYLERRVGAVSILDRP